MYVIPNTGYTLDASAKTITLAAKYSGISHEEINRIVNLTKSDVLYDVSAALDRNNITLANGVITYTSDSSAADTDIIRVELDDMYPPSAPYNSSANVLSVMESSPVDQQLLNTNAIINAVTTTTTSTANYVLSKSRLAVLVTMDDFTSDGAILTVYGGRTPTECDALIATYANGGNTSATSQTISADGTFLYTIEGITVPYITVKITRTDGTISAYLMGAAI
jgi:hypothetical protein